MIKRKNGKIELSERAEKAYNAMSMAESVNFMNKIKLYFRALDECEKTESMALAQIYEHAMDSLFRDIDEMIDIYAHTAE